MLGAKREEVMEGWRKFDSKELAERCVLLTKHYLVSVRWAEHVALWGRVAERIVVGRPDLTLRLLISYIYIYIWSTHS